MEKQRYTIEKRFERELGCDLTQDEVRMAGEEAARRRAERQRTEASFETVRKAHKAQLDEIEEHIEHASRMVLEKRTLRDVICELRFDRAIGVAETIRTDTGEVIASRPLSSDERQGVFLWPTEPEEPMALGDGTSPSL